MRSRLLYFPELLDLNWQSVLLVRDKPDRPFDINLWIYCLTVSKLITITLSPAVLAIATTMCFITIFRFDRATAKVVKTIERERPPIGWPISTFSCG